MTTVIRYTEIDKQSRGWQGRMRRLLNRGWQDNSTLSTDYAYLARINRRFIMLRKVTR